jgi:hypothetical protein
MPATTGVATPILSLRVVGTVGANAPIRRLIEKAAQTFLLGVPVQVDTALGAVQAVGPITTPATAIIIGFSCDYGANLATTGKAQSQTQTGHPPNQPAAVFIPVGAWPNDGTTGFIQALPENVFVGKLGNSVDGTLATIQNTDVTKIYGLAKDAGTGQWYIDGGVTTAAAGACVQITELVDKPGTLNGRLGFVVIAAAQQLY